MRILFFFFFTFLAASVQRKGKGPFDYLLKKELGIKSPEPINVLSRLIFEFFEENKVKEFGAFLDEYPTHTVSQIIHQEFRLYKRDWEEWKLIDAGETTFRKLLAKEKNLYLLFARHMETCPFIRDLAASMMENARRSKSSKRISIVGFIYRLSIIYKESRHAVQNENYIDLFDLLLDYTLGNKVQLEQVGYFTPIRANSLSDFWT